MRVLKGFLLAFAFFVGVSTVPVVAQTQPAGAIDDIIVQGANGATISDTLVGLVKVSITVSVGDPVADAKPDELKAQILETGFFKDVKVEVVVRNGKNVVLITVEQNPVIGEVKFVGSSFPAATLAGFLDQNFNIASDVVVNNAKLEQARAAIGQAYRQSLPFTPDVKLELSAVKDGKVTVTYTINEAVSLKSVTVTGATLVPTADIEALFKPLTSAGKFAVPTYSEALRGVQALYAAKGYRGSGPSLEKTELADGKLSIVIVELKIAAIDATALGIAPEEVALKVGDFFNYNALITETQRLSKGRTKQVGIKIESVSEGSVIVTFTLGEDVTGPISEIRIAGNTAIPTAKLLTLLKQKVGDTYNAQIAEQIDFQAVAQAYQDAGLFIVPTAKVNYLDGVYTITVLEQKLVGYEVAWTGPHKTNDRVILREMPPVGGLLDSNKIRGAFRKIQELGILKDARLDFKLRDPEKPDEVILILQLEEGSSQQFLPGISFNTLEGWSGNISYSDTNAWGLGHRINASFQAGPNDAGQVLSGGASYTIPWLDIKFLDFQTIRTEFSFYVSSNIAGGRVIAPQPALVDNPLTAVNEADPNQGLQRQFTSRNTGFGISFGRELFQNFTIRLSFDFQYEQNFLERKDNTIYPTSDATAQGLLPRDNVTAFTQVSGEYNTKNRTDFPTAGVVVNGSVGYGFGTEGVGSSAPAALSWAQSQVGFKTYLGLGWDSKGELGIGGEDRNFALAFRFNAGVILGDAPSSRVFSIGGAPGNDAVSLRGFDFQDLRGDVYYTGSLELRYDFGLKTSFTYGLLGIAWVDFGNAWGGTKQARRTGIGEGIQFGYGLGVQINLGFGQLLLPAIRLDYGWSAVNPGGRFYFRLGFPF